MPPTEWAMNSQGVSAGMPRCASACRAWATTRGNSRGMGESPRKRGIATHSRWEAQWRWIASPTGT